MKVTICKYKRITCLHRVAKVDRERNVWYLDSHLMTVECGGPWMRSLVYAHRMD